MSNQHHRNPLFRSAALALITTFALGLSAAGQGTNISNTLSNVGVDISIEAFDPDGTFISSATGTYADAHAHAAATGAGLAPVNTGGGIEIHVNGPATGMGYLMIDAFVRDAALGGDQPIYNSLVNGAGFSFLAPAGTTQPNGSNGLPSALYVPIAFFDEARNAALLPSLLSPAPSTAAQNILSYLQPLYYTTGNSFSTASSGLWTADNPCWNHWGPPTTTQWTKWALKPKDPSTATPDDVKRFDPEPLWKMALSRKTSFDFLRAKKPSGGSYYADALAGGLGLSIQPIVILGNDTTDLDAGQCVVANPPGLPGLPDLNGIPDLADQLPQLGPVVHLSISPLFSTTGSSPSGPTPMGIAYPGRFALDAADGPFTIVARTDSDLPLRLTPDGDSTITLVKPNDPTTTLTLVIYEGSTPGTGAVNAPLSAVGTWNLSKITNPWGVNWLPTTPPTQIIVVR